MILSFQEQPRIEFFDVRVEFFNLRAKFFALRAGFCAVRLGFFGWRVGFFAARVEAQRARVVACAGAAGFYARRANRYGATEEVKHAPLRFFAERVKLNNPAVSVLAERINLIRSLSLASMFELFG